MSQLKSDLEQLREGCQKFQGQMIDGLDIIQKVKQGQDKTLLETNKKLATVFRELERVESQALSKASIEEVQRLTFNSVDKSWVSTQIQEFMTRDEVRRLMQSVLQSDDFGERLEAFEAEVKSANQRAQDQMNRKFEALIED